MNYTLIWDPCMNLTIIPLSQANYYSSSLKDLIHTSLSQLQTLSSSLLPNLVSVQSTFYWPV